MTQRLRSAASRSAFLASPIVISIAVLASAPAVGSTKADGRIGTALRAPSNAFSWSGVTRNKKKGTAGLYIGTDVEGTVLVFGPRIKTEQGSRNGLPAPGSQVYTAPVIPKASLMKKLSNRHKVSVTLSVTFTPDGGTANTRSRTVGLIKEP